MKQPPTALLFVGQGGEHVGMSAALAAACPDCATLLGLPDTLVGYSLWQLMQRGPEEQLHRTEHAQPALLTAAVADALHLLAGGETPVALLGHSVGQYAALVVARSLELGDAIRLVALRGRLMQRTVPAGEGAMAVILRMPRRQVVAACAAAGGAVVVACHNAADETVISGEASAVERVADRCDDDGATVVVLPASAPFHSPLLRPMLAEFGRALDEAPVRDPALPVIDNVTAQVLATAGAVRRSLHDQIEAPVLFEEGLQTLGAMGVTRFVGCGPGKSVLRLARAAFPDADVRMFGTADDLTSRAHA